MQDLRRRRHIGVLFENNSQVSAVDIKKWPLSNHQGYDFGAVNIKTQTERDGLCNHLMN